MSDDGPLPGGAAPAGVADTTAAEDTENDLARGLAAFSTSRRSPQQTNLTSPSSSDTALKATHQDTAAASVEAAHAQASPASPTTGAPAADTAGAGDVGDTLGAVAESLSVRCGTFNVNAKEVVMENGRFVNLSAWVGSDKDADIWWVGSAVSLHGFVALFPLRGRKVVDMFVHPLCMLWAQAFLATVVLLSIC